MSVEKFDKEYSFNIRHSYGKEGRRLNYDTWSCAAILKGERPKGCMLKN